MRIKPTQASILQRMRLERRVGPLASIQPVDASLCELLAWSFGVEFGWGRVLEANALKR